MATNVFGLAEVGEIEAQKPKLLLMFNQIRNPPALQVVMCLSATPFLALLYE